MIFLVEGDWRFFLEGIFFGEFITGKGSIEILNYEVTEVVVLK